jgi:hypothetical protein
MCRRRKTTKSLAAPNPSLPGPPRTFSSWSRIQKDTLRRAAGASLNSKTDNLRAMRSLKPVSHATSLPKAMTSSLRGMRRDSFAVVLRSQCRGLLAAYPVFNQLQGRRESAQRRRRPLRPPPQRAWSSQPVHRQLRIRRVEWSQAAGEAGNLDEPRRRKQTP